MEVLFDMMEERKRGREEERKRGEILPPLQFELITFSSTTYSTAVLRSISARVSAGLQYLTTLLPYYLSLLLRASVRRDERVTLRCMADAKKSMLNQVPYLKGKVR